MSRILVAYGVATAKPKGYEVDRQVKNAEGWAKNNGCSVLIWRREGQSTIRKRIEERTRLHQALFCIRANFADDLWLPEWPHDWDDWDKALILAVLDAHGGRLIINGDPHTPDPADATRQRAREWLGLLEELDPRLGQPDGDSGQRPDIGAHLGEEEAYRLARKLKDDFGLPEKKIAEWLGDYEYSSERGNGYTDRGVQRLLNKYTPSALDVDQYVMTQTRNDHRAFKTWVTTFGPTAESLVKETAAWNASQPVPAQHVVPINPNDTASDPALPLAQRPDLKTVLLAWPFTSAVHVVAASDLADDVRDLMFVLAYLETYGVRVVVDGVALVIGGGDLPSTETYLQGRSTVLLHQILRRHDQGTVTDPALTHASAYAVAERIRNQGQRRSLAHAASHLNREGIPTRRGHGQWWPTAVQELLDQGPR